MRSLPLLLATFALACTGSLVHAQTAQQLLCGVNTARLQNGLPCLGPDPDLNTAAQGHSDDMADNNTLDHNGSDGSSPLTRIQAECCNVFGVGCTYSATAENIAYGSSDVSTVMQMWLDSPGHYANIMDSTMTNMGCGIAPGSGGLVYYTTDFGSDPSHANEYSDGC